MGAEIGSDLEGRQQGRDRELIWSVSELTSRLKRAVEPPFTDVWVQGELSGCKGSASGHLYFSLKDPQSLIQAAFFGWGRKRSAWNPQDGLEVLCHGKISLYAPRGSVQLVVDRMEPVGAGALQLAFEQLKQKLNAEGLFSSELKRPLPRFPKRVAVVTSAQAAALQDFITVLWRRAPHVEVVLLPALMQGEQAPGQIISALRKLKAHALGAESKGIDLVVITRGGGSLEDLWCFNDEALAREIRQSPVPVVSAVGHEVDFTICDFVADVRAPTPSAAAEMISLYWVQAIRDLGHAAEQSNRLIMQRLERLREGWEQWRARVIHPRDKLRERAQMLDEWMGRLHRAGSLKAAWVRQRQEGLMQQLLALSPMGVLERGYVIVRDMDGRAMARSKTLQSSLEYSSTPVEVELQFFDGSQRAVVANQDVP